MRSLIASVMLALWALPAMSADFSQLTRPTLVFVSQTGCGFCERLDREILSPMDAAGDFEGAVSLTRISIDLGNTLIDFDGTSINAHQFAQRYGAHGTPTLLFLDPQGKARRPALFGVPDAIEFYGVKIEREMRRLAESNQTNPGS